MARNIDELMVWSPELVEHMRRQYAFASAELRINCATSGEIEWGLNRKR